MYRLIIIDKVSMVVHYLAKKTGLLTDLLLTSERVLLSAYMYSRLCEAEPRKCWEGSPFSFWSTASSHEVGLVQQLHSK